MSLTKVAWIITIDACLSTFLPAHHNTSQVVQVPTNKPLIRADLSPRLYFDPKARTKALCNLVQDCWDKFRCVPVEAQVGARHA